MEPSPGTPARARRLRYLNTPAPIEVQSGPDLDAPPRAVVLHERRRKVAAIQEVWRVDEGWWRKELVSRRYYRLVLDDGRQLTVYRDLAKGTWWAQRY